MSAIQNLNSFDPFADASKGGDLLSAGTEDSIHIRIQQRNGRKTLTTVQGISEQYDKKKLVKAFKKKFACNGTVVDHAEYGEVIQLQGDQRKNACQFWWRNIIQCPTCIEMSESGDLIWNSRIPFQVGLVKEEQLKVHGF
ncbi:eukaryotic translation initiation factor 1b-like [Gastrophryne carolinensis]